MEAEKSFHTSSAAVTKRVLTIHDLDDDSLGIIFNKLPRYRDRVCVGSVCKRWREVSKVNWRSYSKHLIIGSDYFPSLHNNPEETKNVLDEILIRYGHYLEEITFTDHEHNFESGTMKEIIECCPRLKRIGTGCLKLNAEDWMACRNLEALSLYSECGELRELFHRNKRLRRLEMYSVSCKASDFDPLDPGHLEILHSCCEGFRLTGGLANKVAESLVELKYFPSYSVPLIYPYDLQPLSVLKNLRTLSLVLHYIIMLETHLILDIAKYLPKKLEHITLCLASGNNINQNSIAQVFNLPCLKSLVLIVDQYKIPYAELDRLFRKAPNLKFFVLSSCHRCIYKVNNIILCCKHRKSRVKNKNSVASDSSEAVIITDA